MVAQSSHGFPRWAVTMLGEMRASKWVTILSISSTALIGVIGVYPVIAKLLSHEIIVIDGNGKDVSPVRDEYNKFDENYSYRVLDGVIELGMWQQVRVSLTLTAIDAKGQPVYKSWLTGSGEFNGNTAYIRYTCTMPSSSMHWSGVMIMTIPIEGHIEIYFISENTRQVGRYLMGTLSLERRVL